MREITTNVFSIETIHSVAIIFFELGVVKKLMQKYNLKTLHDYLFVLKLGLITKISCINKIVSVNHVL